MKKLLICIGLFTASSFVHAAAREWKEIAIVWRVEADARLRLPGERMHRYVSKFTPNDLKFYPCPEVASPIFIEFNHEQAALLSSRRGGREFKVELPKGVASWHALPNGTKITIATYRPSHEYKPVLEVTLGQSLQVSDSHEVERSVAGIRDSMASVAAAVALVAQAPQATYAALELSVVTLKDDGE